MYNKVSGIYKISSKCKPNKIYIGSSINIKARWNEHKRELRLNIHSNGRLQNHYNKYGKDDLIFEVITTCQPEDLIINEQFFIDAYKPFFNISPTAGSCLGYKLTEEHKRKISEGVRGIKRSEETRRKMAEAKRGKHYLLGTHWPEERKKKLSKTNTGRKMSPEWCKNMGKTKIGNKNRLGKYHSDETKKKISETRKINHDKISKSLKEAWRKRKEKLLQNPTSMD